ncbi:MAG: hypothetical protein ACYTG0_40245 [Planctomycetota bacterium]|jgi:hypothetical protein
MRTVRTPVKAIREYCLDCSATSKGVMWCSCDGKHSTWCPLWPYRFGMRPETARQKYGDQLLDPEQMPDANKPLEELPVSPSRGRQAERRGKQDPGVLGETAGVGLVVGTVGSR